MFAGHFSLTTTSGVAVSDETYRGKWQLIYFGYTSCPDICPTVLAEVDNALDSLGPLSEKIQPIFITLDPVRDSPELVRNYLRAFGTRIVGLVGSTDAVNAAAKSYRVYYRERSLGGDAYTIDHSSFLFVMKPDGSFAALVPGDTPGHKLADELRRIVQ